MAEQAIIEFQGDPSGLKPLADALKALGQLTDEQIKAFNDASKAAESFGQKASKATKETEKSAEDLNKSFKEFQEGIIGGATEEFAKQMKGMGLEATKVTETSKRLTTQLRELKNQLATLPEGSKEFKRVAIEAAKLEDKIGDVSREVRILASDSLALDTMTGIARGIAGGFALAQGAAALFGKENEDVQKALLKVNAAMAILQGLQEVSLILRKEEVVRVGLAAAAQRAYAFVVNTSTGAVRAFNLALATIAVGAVIAGIALLVTYWEDIAKFIGLAKDEQEELNDATKEYLDLNNTNIRRIKENLTIAQKSTSDLTDELNRLSTELSNVPTEGLTIEVLGKTIKGDTGKARKAIQDQINVIKAELEKRNKAITDLNKIPAGEGISTFDKIEPSAIPTQEVKIAPVLSQEDVDRVNAEQARIRQEEIDAEKAKQQAIKDNAIAIAQETFSAIFAITSQRRNAEFQEELAALEKEKQAKLANKKLTDGQRAAIEEQFRKREARIKEEQFRREKQAKIIQVAIETALAVIKAAPNPVLMGLAAATGAISAATIAAQPIPKFAKGTKNAPEGLALVGEQGAELVHLPQGAKVIPHPASMKILDGHIDAERILSDYNISTTNTTKIDYDKLAEALDKKLSKHARPFVNIDENGFMAYLQSENHRKAILNKRFKFG